MQFIRCAVVGVFIALYLSTESRCYYIPENKTSPASKRNGTSSISSKRIQICGTTLTTTVMEACDGFVSSLNQVGSSRDSVQTKITEDCCDQGCTLDYLQNYCGGTPLFTIKNARPGSTALNEIVNIMSKISGADLGPNARRVQKSKSKGLPEVRVRDKKYEKKKLGMNRKKKKRSFKRKCAYKSFGHYLLKLDRGDGVRNKLAKVHSVNRPWPSIQIGTVSPEIDKFGGQPIVVVKKSKSKFV